MNTNISANINADVTISSSAILVDLSIRGSDFTKQDKDVADEVKVVKGATSVNAGTYQKNLLAGSKELKAVKQYTAIIRRWHKHRTLPWADSGVRLLPAVLFMMYMNELAVHEVEYKRLVDEFVHSYRLAIQVAQLELSSLFKLSDYPDPSEIPSKFEMRFSTYPLPEHGDFRVDIGNEGLNELREHFKVKQDLRVQEAMSEVRERVKTALTKVSSALRVEDDGKKGRIHDATLEGAIELCDSLEGFNLTRDPELEQLRKEMRNTLNGIDPVDMRKDDVVRTFAKQEVDALLDKFSLV